MKAAFFLLVDGYHLTKMQDSKLQTYIWVHMLQCACLLTSHINCQNCNEYIAYTSIDD